MFLKSMEMGRKTIRDKCEAIKLIPTPANIKQLQAFLGVINYYRKFIPNLARRASCLYSLMNNNACWKWTDEEETVVRTIEECSDE